MNKILITLSGTHGSGKSTNAGKCYYLLNKAGYRFSYLRHQDLLDPFGFIVRRAARILHTSAEELEKLTPTRVLWSLYLLYIYYPILLAGIGIRKLLGYSTVCDRYVYDLIVAFRDNDMSVPSESLLLRLIPRPNASFVMDAPEQRILADRPEHTAEFIRKEKWLYLKLADDFNLTKINTGDSPSIVWDKITAQVRTALGEGPPIKRIPVQAVIQA
jgi:thymidylate kinase